MIKGQLRIVFMGTPEFAVASLQKLVEEQYNVVGVVTVPDKPEGRGLVLSESAVKKFAVQHRIPVLQPEKLKSDDFLQRLKALQPDVQIVVAYRMLPEQVWSLPRYGTINLHGSLLPQYRGAAPINWAIINGEQQTGVTTFLIDKEIDTGKIILQDTIPIGKHETAGELHDRMMMMGANLIVKTLGMILDGTCKSIEQKHFIDINSSLKPAPKIFKPDCKINWNQKAIEVFNFIRGLNPYPAAHTYIHIKNKKLLLKIFDCQIINQEHRTLAGTIQSDNKTFFHVAVTDGWLDVKLLQMEGKKRLPIQEFLRGNDVSTVKHFDE